MIWAEKLAKANTTAGEMLRKARRTASNPDMPNEGLDSFMNAMDLGDPDPSNHRTEFKSADDIVEWFSQEKQMTGDNATNLSSFFLRFSFLIKTEVLGLAFGFPLGFSTNDLSLRRS